jgi:hypothetical protein
MRCLSPQGCPTVHLGGRLWTNARPTYESGFPSEIAGFCLPRMPESGVPAIAELVEWTVDQKLDSNLIPAQSAAHSGL